MPVNSPDSAVLSPVSVYFTGLQFSPSSVQRQLLSASKNSAMGGSPSKGRVVTVSPSHSYSPS